MFMARCLIKYREGFIFLPYGFSSKGCIRMMKSRRMRWTGHAAFMRELVGMRPLARPAFRRAPTGGLW
jgi:hypothetical protein